MEGYNVQLKESSIANLSNRERIKLKDLSNAIKFDEIVNVGENLTITPDQWAVLVIHNEKSDNKDYDTYVIIDDAGTKYSTGSSSFWTSFRDIADEVGDEEYSIEIYKKESKNYKGKYFLTCSIV